MIDLKTWVIVRTYSAGVHFGRLKNLKGKKCVLTDSRRIWYWSGAASISEIAVSGIKNLDESKIAVPLKEIYLSEAIEVIPCSPESEKCLREAPAWSA